VPFDGMVFDELSKCKNSATQRVKAFMKIIDCFKWSTGLTGTPASNGIKDLHGQFLVLDKGQRLGRSKTAFKTKFFRKIGFYKEVPYPDTEQRVKELVGDITLNMDARDYIKMPDLIINDIRLELPNFLKEKYEQLEEEFFFKLDSGDNVEVFNKASLTNKLLQFANGFVYPIPSAPTWEEIHDVKLDALTDIIEESSGQPVLCAYSYRADAQRIMKRFKELRPINLTQCKTQESLSNAMERWKTGDCVLMIGHPASMGHGIDGLQDNGHILAWFGLNWSLDLYDQFNARICRQGQGEPVVCHRLLTLDTIEQAQALALNNKAATQTSLREALNSYRKNKFQQ